jgi:hypothetical protein
MNTKIFSNKLLILIIFESLFISNLYNKRREREKNDHDKI